VKHAVFQVSRWLWCVVLLAALTATMSAQSVSLNGSGTLSYSVVEGPVTPCIPGTRFLNPSYREWDFSGFVFTDVSGVRHSLPGSTVYFQVAGTSPDCPPAGGNPIVLSGSGFFINAQPEAAGALAANLNVELFPKYKVISILYDSPGDKSSNGFTDAVNNSVTTTISQTFTSATTKAVGGSFLGTGLEVSFTVSRSTQDTAAYQFSTSNGHGKSLPSVANSVDHSQDQFFIWLNPMVIVTPTGPNSANYSLATPIGSNGQPEPMDVVNINVKDLQNPSLIPIGVLQPQTVDMVSGLPGLADICANPVPNCNSAPCGCVGSDFTAVLATDPLISISSQTTQPNQIDPSRYSFIESQTLEGPQCDGCDPLINSFTQTDSQSVSETLGQSLSYSVGYKVTSGFSLFGSGLTLSKTNTFSWTDAMSTGSANGTSHSAAINLGSASVDCDESVNIYEDTVFHTFALAPANVSPFCN